MRGLNSKLSQKLGINEDVIFPSVHFHANIIFQPTLDGSTIWSLFKVAEKRNDLAPADFTCYVNCNLLFLHWRPRGFLRAYL